MAIDFDFLIQEFEKDYNPFQKPATPKVKLPATLIDAGNTEAMSKLMVGLQEAYPDEEVSYDNLGAVLDRFNRETIKPVRLYQSNGDTWITEQTSKLSSWLNAKFADSKERRSFFNPIQVASGLALGATDLVLAVPQLTEMMSKELGSIYGTIESSDDFIEAIKLVSQLDRTMVGAYGQKIIESMGEKIEPSKADIAKGTIKSIGAGAKGLIGGIYHHYKDNPYAMVTDLYGIDFLTAKMLAKPSLAKQVLQEGAEKATSGVVAGGVGAYRAVKAVAKEIKGTALEGALKGKGVFSFVGDRIISKQAKGVAEGLGKAVEGIGEKLQQQAVNINLKPEIKSDLFKKSAVNFELLRSGKIGVEEATENLGKYLGKIGFNPEQSKDILDGFKFDIQLFAVKGGTLDPSELAFNTVSPVKYEKFVFRFDDVMRQIGDEASTNYALYGSRIIEAKDIFNLTSEEAKSVVEKMLQKEGIATEGKSFKNLLNYIDNSEKAKEVLINFTNDAHQRGAISQLRFEELVNLQTNKESVAIKRALSGDEILFRQLNGTPLGQTKEELSAFTKSLGKNAEYQSLLKKEKKIKKEININLSKRKGLAGPERLELEKKLAGIRNDLTETEVALAQIKTNKFHEIRAEYNPWASTVTKEGEQLNKWFGGLNEFRFASEVFRDIEKNTNIPVYSKYYKDLEAAHLNFSKEYNSKFKKMVDDLHNIIDPDTGIKRVIKESELEDIRSVFVDINKLKTNWEGALSALQEEGMTHYVDWMNRWRNVDLEIFGEFSQVANYISNPTEVLAGKKPRFITGEGALYREGRVAFDRGPKNIERSSAKAKTQGVIRNITRDNRLTFNAEIISPLETIKSQLSKGLKERHLTVPISAFEDFTNMFFMKSGDSVSHTSAYNHFDRYMKMVTGELQLGTSDLAITQTVQNLWKKIDPTHAPTNNDARSVVRWFHKRFISGALAFSIPSTTKNLTQKFLIMGETGPRIWADALKRSFDSEMWDLAFEAGVIPKKFESFQGNVLKSIIEDVVQAGGAGKTGGLKGKMKELAEVGKAGSDRFGYFTESTMADLSKATQTGVRAKSPKFVKTLKKADQVLDKISEVGMIPYTLLADAHSRVMAFTAGRVNLLEAHKRFVSGAISWDDFINQSLIGTRHSVDKKMIIDLIKTGKLEQAANEMGRNFASATQFTYGGINKALSQSTIAGSVSEFLSTWPKGLSELYARRLKNIYEDVEKMGLNGAMRNSVALQNFGSELATQMSVAYSAYGVLGADIWSWFFLGPLSGTFSEDSPGIKLGKATVGLAESVATLDSKEAKKNIREASYFLPYFVPGGSQLRRTARAIKDDTRIRQGEKIKVPKPMHKRIMQFGGIPVKQEMKEEWNQQAKEYADMYAKRQKALQSMGGI